MIKVNLPKLSRQDTMFLLSSVVIPLILWWFLIGRNRYSVPNGAK